MFDCFVSYKVGADDSLAHDFASFLKDDDFTVFIDKKGLLPGTNWSLELQQSMQNSNYVLAFFTEDYVARIEHGNTDGQNFIIEELNWALKDKKLIPISVGVPVNVIEEKCSEWVTELNGIQFISFEDKDSVQFQLILNQLNKLIRKRSKYQGSQKSSSIQVTPNAFTSHDAYLKLTMPWTTNEALKYKAELESKFLKEPIDYVVLAKFHLIGRFGIKRDPEIAYQHLQKAAGRNCREAYFELGMLHEFEDTKYGGDEDKATEYYTKAHQAGDIRATYRLALLFDENIENSNCPTQFLKNKYGIASANQFISHVFDQSANYGSFNFAEQYCYCLTQIHANENKAQAIEKIHQLANKGYLKACGWLGLEYSENDSEVIQDTQESLKYLDAGDQQGDTWCRGYLACIYLETEYSALGFEENIPLGIEKHRQNISINSFDSANALAWVLEKRPELQRHISNDEQIVFLEKAVNFGQLNCREFLAKAYIKAKHPSLGKFSIKSAQNGDFTPAVLLLAQFAVNTDFKGVISEDDYLTLYALIKKEIQAASPKHALHMNIMLMNFAMYNNRLQDALNLVQLISEENKKEGAYYFYAKQVALKGYCYSQRLVFELLKKGSVYSKEFNVLGKTIGYKSTFREENSAKWLLHILIGTINPCYEHYLESVNFDDSFVNEFLKTTSQSMKHDSHATNLEFVDDGEKLNYISTSNEECKKSAKEIFVRRVCEKYLSSSETVGVEFLNAYADLNYNSAIPPAYNILKNSAFDLGIACYKKLFSEADNKNSHISQSALLIHLKHMIESDNVDNNKGHIEYCFNKIVATFNSSDDAGVSILDTIKHFQSLWSTFINIDNMDSYEELTNTVYSTLNQMLFNFVKYYEEPSKAPLIELIFEGIQLLTDDIQQSRFRDKLLFDLGCLYIAIYPKTSISMDITCINTSSHILVFNLYNKYDDFKFNQITKMEIVPTSIILMLKLAAEEYSQKSEDSMLKAARGLLQGFTKKETKKSELEFSNDSNVLSQQAKTIIRSREFKQFINKYN